MGYSALKNALIFMYYAVPLLGRIGVVMSIGQADDYFPEERDGLLQLRDFINSTSNLHGNWTGPPCHKNGSRWAGIGCRNGHVIHLVLEGNQLTGSLPQTPFLGNMTFLRKLSFRNNSIRGRLPSLKNLLYLERVFLSRNSFSGSIPSDYTDLPRLTKLELQHNSLTGSIPPFDQPTLTTLNVSHNHLAGRIPSNQVLDRFPKSSYDHNSALCGKPLGIPCSLPPPSNGKTKGTRGIWRFVLIAACAAGLVAFLVMLVFLCYYRKVRGKDAKGDQSGKGYAGIEEKKRNRSENGDDPERMVKLEFFDKKRPVFDSDDLLRASAKVMGKGKLGTTYRATLESGSALVVKRLKETSAWSNRDFVQQMQQLGSTRHENLVEIISFYYEEEKLVIYEFIPHGNRCSWVIDNRGVGRVPLNWTARLSIIKEIAEGLAFLHQSLPSHRVPHANLKSSNVLIQRDGLKLHSKLTDFGLLPLLTPRKSFENLAVGKTPEFSQGKNLTYKADVYCFGIILLEVITGKNPDEMSRGSGGMFDDLSDRVRSAVNSDCLTDVLDVEILSAREDRDDMLRLVEMALECTDVTPAKRPKMSEFLRRIEEMEQLNKQTGDAITRSTPVSSDPVFQIQPDIEEPYLAGFHFEEAGFLETGPKQSASRRSRLNYVFNRNP
ncbi:hypothetical protein RHGRI_023436 [Rhododendron griersonianum]|uniref:Protein kinase domain-containing protein n=1 Tax=Rhododendron griersonianum TaxID=479676 RepID=A0AAV6J901_9ERIC|nr:hypothetical protein RHGRI_023436 [Rhododendron griersonianum]